MATRRRPNAFNLLHQLQFERRAGRLVDKSLEARLIVFSFVDFILQFWGEAIFFPPNSWQAWESSTEFAEAYRLGPAERQATMNLLNHVPPDVVDRWVAWWGAADASFASCGRRHFVRLDVWFQNQTAQRFHDFALQDVFDVKDFDPRMPCGWMLEQRLFLGRFYACCLGVYSHELRGGIEFACLPYGVWLPGVGPQNAPCIQTSWRRILHVITIISVMNCRHDSLIQPSFVSFLNARFNWGQFAALLLLVFGVWTDLPPEGACELRYGGAGEDQEVVPSFKQSFSSVFGRPVWNSYP